MIRNIFLLMYLSCQSWLFQVEARQQWELLHKEVHKDQWVNYYNYSWFWLIFYWFWPNFIPILYSFFIIIQNIPPRVGVISIPPQSRPPPPSHPGAPRPIPEVHPGAPRPIPDTHPGAPRPVPTAETKPTELPPGKKIVLLGFFYRGQSRRFITHLCY